jgi:hypothetical protein
MAAMVRLEPVRGGGLLLESGKSFSLRGRLLSRFAKSYPEARSSAGEHFPDTEGVGGSIPPVPTTRQPKALLWYAGRMP